LAAPASGVKDSWPSVPAGRPSPGLRPPRRTSRPGPPRRAARPGRAPVTVSRGPAARPGADVRRLDRCAPLVVKYF